MRNLIVAIVLVAGVCFSAPVKVNTARVDSAVTAQKIKDSILFSELRKAVPDSLRARVDSAQKVWKSIQPTNKKVDAVVVDSLNKVFSEKRDSILSKIKDTAEAVKIKARIAVLEAERAELKAKLDARKSEIVSKILDLKK